MMRQARIWFSVPMTQKKPSKASRCLLLPNQTAGELLYNQWAASGAAGALNM